MYRVENMLRVLFGYGAAVLATYVACVLLISQTNLSNIIAMGGIVDASIRFDAVWHDLSHMYLYLLMVAVSFAIALPAATWVIRWLPDLRLIGYVLAGFVGLVVIHIVLKASFGGSIIAPTRTIMGLLAQGLAGAIGGYLFHRITRVTVLPGNPDV
ncbi:MAG: hypothetical protein ACI9SB_001408 [Candidatus Azotimanducaceae bacterium]